MQARLHEQYPLRGLNSFGVEARARWFCRVRGADDLAALAADPRLAGLPRLVLGGGSNLLLTRDFDGLVIKVDVPELREHGEADDAWHVEVGAGDCDVQNSLAAAMLLPLAVFFGLQRFFVRGLTAGYEEALRSEERFSRNAETATLSRMPSSA